jgi:hypothetical protein
MNIYNESTGRTIREETSTSHIYDQKRKLYQPLDIPAIKDQLILPS